jgi:hypothetical protein
MSSRFVVAVVTLTLAANGTLFAAKPAPSPNPTIAARSWSPAGVAVMNEDGSNKVIVSPLCWTPSWAPGGNATASSPLQLVCAQDQNGQKWLERISVDKGAVLSSRSTISGPLAPTAPAWSPLGDEIVYANGTTLETVSPDGGDPTILYAGGALSDIAWSRDGSTIYFVERSGGQESIRALARSSLMMDPIMSPGAFSNIGVMSYARTSETLAFCGTPAGSTRHSIYTLDMADPTASPVSITEGHHPRFSPDDKRLALSLSGGMFFKLQIYDLVRKRSKTIDGDAVTPDWRY